MKKERTCPKCGETIEIYKNPFPTVDIIIEVEEKIVLIKRKNPPLGWALPGGFVDYGESLEEAAIREAREETGLEVELVCQFYTYSAPGRDPRFHTITTVYIAKARGEPEGADDAALARLFSLDEIPFNELVFDHGNIIADYINWKHGKSEFLPGKACKKKIPRC
ncbi:NUDIX hydrolase [Thermodesulfatator indicus DSM 15286]|uniref:NUDIX hydrolase n=1 Tax=Thermodesulfatator indicus (strain DSM 15286 / JCM 11887 / CIR29812) TaxID=667014 RepID=F8A975_THEID|nr:NUDIX hydrolase [Thermodesulfatator indicus]AEH45184.1 NUDIX hydrolase [Thermodesulfatator indicus DSM 15286]